MIVDDRLETVLRTVAASSGAIRTQFRQLADILGRTAAEGWTQTHVAALDRIGALHTALGDADSARLLGTCVLRSPILVEHFAELGPKVALAAITSARLREAEWMALIPDLPVQARGFLRHRRDLGPAVQALLARFGITDFALPLPAGFEPLVVEAKASDVPPPSAGQTAAKPLPPAPQGEGIGAIVRRIEAFRRNREAQAAHALAVSEHDGGPGQTRLPFVDEPAQAPREVTAIDLRFDAEITVIGADAFYAAQFVGLRPFSGDPDAPASSDPASICAVRARQPVEGGLLLIEGGPDVSGTWRIDAVPLFAPETGHFQGYHARLRRPQGAQAAAMNAANPAANDDDAGSSADRLRQMLHELRTPINAIQGFAELIQQQMLGPTPHQYRSLAAGIASDAARMLAGFEDIERLVSLESRQSGVTGSGEADLAALLTRLVAQLQPVLAPREVKLRCGGIGAPLHIAVDAAELELTLWRLLSLMASAAAPGERLAIMLEARGESARLSLPLPAALAMLDDGALMTPRVVSLGASSDGATLGGGFALRLAAAEIRAAGGTLERRGAQLEIAFPLLTSAQRQPSQGISSAGNAG